MKNLWDAVNELRGDLDNTYLFNDNVDTYLFYHLSDGDYVCGAREDENKDERLVCTIAEFSVLEGEMALNFGKCTPLESTNYHLADKTTLEKEALDSIVNKPLVYTQEMVDNGVLPSVGMECEFETTFFTHEPSNTGTGTTIAYHDNKVWFSTGSKEFVISLDVITFKPLTLPITLIDGEAYQFMDRTGEILNGIYDKGTRVFNVLQGRYFNVISCTNIKRLTAAEE